MIRLFERLAIYRALRRAERGGGLIRIEADQVEGSMAARVLSAGPWLVHLELWQCEPEVSAWGEALIPLSGIRYIETWQKKMARDLAAASLGLMLEAERGHEPPEAREAHVR